MQYPRKFLPKQKQVLDATHKHKFILYSGAYGAGKTLLLANVVIRECLNHPGSLWFVGSQTVPQLRDTVVRTFLEEMDLYQDMLQKEGYGINLQKQWRPSIMTYDMFNGSRILFRSCDEPSKFKSLNLDGAAIDEPVDISEEIFLMLQGRLRGHHTKHRFIIMAGNPSGFTNWVYRKFFEDKNPDCFVVHTTTYDNSFLPPDYIPSMEKSFDLDYANRYLRGEWGEFEGLIYKDFNREFHVGNYRDGEYKYFIGGVDYGYRNPACLLTMGIDAENRIYVVDELYEKNRTSKELAEMMNEANMVFPMRKVYVDPSAQDMIAQLKDKHMRVVDANNDIEQGIAKLKSFFKNNIVFIDFGCKNLIKELQSYRYEKDHVTKNATERPIKKDDHACDALRYGVSEHNPFRKPLLCFGGRLR